VRHPVSTHHGQNGQERLGAAMTGDVIGPSILPAPPQDADPRAGEDPDRVGMVTAARLGPRVDIGRRG